MSSAAFLEALRKRRTRAPQRRFSFGNVCYFASHVLRGWARQQDGDVTPLEEAVAADLAAFSSEDQAMRRCAAIVLVEWEWGGLAASEKVAMASSEPVWRRTRDRPYLQQVFRGMDAAFDGLYRVRV